MRSFMRSLRRPLVGLLALAALAASAPAAAQVTAALAPAHPMLKSAVTVSGELVRIGDLVENAGAVANIPIFRSPDLGETGSVPAARVLDAVRAHDLIGVDTHGIAEVSVTRSGRAIARAEIEARLAGAFATQLGIADASALSITFDYDVPTLYVEPTATAPVQLARAYYDRRSGRFDVGVIVPGSEATRRVPWRFTGIAVETREVPILTRPIAKGETIGEADLLVQRRPRSQLPADALDAKERAVGLAAKRPLQAGQPLRGDDLMRPQLVQRDHVVTLTYEGPGIVLSMRAKALDSGAEGDVINVVNMQSKRTLEAIVIGPGQVAIKPPPAPPAATPARAAAATPDAPAPAAVPTPAAAAAAAPDLSRAAFNATSLAASAE